MLVHTVLPLRNLRHNFFAIIFFVEIVTDVIILQLDYFLCLKYSLKKIGFFLKRGDVTVSDMLSCNVRIALMTFN